MHISIPAVTNTSTAANNLKSGRHSLQGTATIALHSNTLQGTRNRNEIQITTFHRALWKGTTAKGTFGHRSVMTRLEENGSEWEQLGIPCIRAAIAGETPPPGDPPALYGKPGLSPVGSMYDTHNTVRTYSWHSCTPELRNDSTVIFSAQGTRKQWLPAYISPATRSLPPAIHPDAQLLVSPWDFGSFNTQTPAEQKFSLSN